MSLSGYPGVRHNFIPDFELQLPKVAISRNPALNTCPTCEQGIMYIEPPQSHDLR